MSKVNHHPKTKILPNLVTLMNFQLDLRNTFFVLQGTLPTESENRLSMAVAQAITIFSNKRAVGVQITSTLVATGDTRNPFYNIDPAHKCVCAN
jgi:hypothetical protein